MKHSSKTSGFGRLWLALPITALAFGCTATGVGDTDADANGDEAEVPECEDNCELGTQQTPETARKVCEASVRGPQTLRRLTAPEVRATLQDIFPELGGDWNTRLSQDISSKLSFTNDTTTLVVGGSTAKEMLKTAEDVGDLVTADGVLANVLPCAVEAADAACATEYVNSRGLRLFRRPLTEEETTRYVTYQQSVTERADFATGIKWVTTALIQSPHAFYRSELGKDDGNGGFALTQDELATEISYVYTGSTPDQALLDAAAAGELGTPEELAAQAQRLLSSHPRRLEAVSDFFLQWLQYGRVRGQSRVEAPLFAEQISVAMLEETKTFLQTLVFVDNADVRDLMTANYTGMNELLSTFYGYGDVTGDGYVKVERPAGRGIGVLSQGSILAATGHQDATSPTLRGLLFYTRFLCNSRPKPPDIVPPIEEAEGVADAKTTREKFEIHHGVGVCANCHKPFEPFGYTMEQFDETGRYRPDEDGVTIDTVASVMLNDKSKVEVKNLDELALLVDENDDIENCMSGMLAAYMFSGAGGQHCLAEPERKQLAAGEISIQEFLVQLTAAPHFTSRRAPQ